MFIWKLAMHRNLKDYQKQHLGEIQLEKGEGLKELGGEKNLEREWLQTWK